MLFYLPVIKQVGRGKVSRLFRSDFLRISCDADIFANPPVGDVTQMYRIASALRSVARKRNHRSARSKSDPNKFAPCRSGAHRALGQALRHHPQSEHSSHFVYPDLSAHSSEICLYKSAFAQPTDQKIIGRLAANYPNGSARPARAVAPRARHARLNAGCPPELFPLQPVSHLRGREAGVHDAGPKGPVIQRDSSGGRVNRPSSDMPHFAMTKGCLLTIHLLKASLRRAQSSARTPSRTLMSASRSRLMPLP